VSLRELAIDWGTLLPSGATTVLQRANVNGNADCVSGQSWGNDRVVFGDIGGNGHFCPVPGGALQLAPGTHYLAAYYEGSGSGDNKFAPAVSPTLVYTVTAPVILSAQISGGNNQTTQIGSVFGSPLSVKVVANAGTSVANVPVTFSPQFGQGFFGLNPIGTLQGSGLVMTNAQGIATSPVILANFFPGSWTVNATAQGIAGTLSFKLTNSLTKSSAPDLLLAITSKTGALASRTWQFTLSNPSPQTLAGLSITKLILAQESGAACTPAIVSGIPFTAAAPLPPNGSVQTDVVLDFSSCAANSRFTVTAAVTANDGAYNTSEIVGHQYP
jgi:hypothetical protein